MFQRVLSLKRSQGHSRKFQNSSRGFHGVPGILQGIAGGFSCVEFPGRSKVFQWVSGRFKSVDGISWTVKGVPVDISRYHLKA